MTYQHEGPVVTITLDRPERMNAISWAMFSEIGAAFRRAGHDGAVRCVVLTGAGDAFCSGADVKDPENIPASIFEARERMRTIDAIVRSVAHCPKPTIARVTGVAAGAGCNLALLCDLIVASRAASFIELFVKRGLVVDFGGTWALTRALPLHRAKELALLGEVISAEQAYTMGFVNRLCDPDEVDTVVKDLVERIVALPPSAVGFIKENLNRAAERSLEENLAAENSAQPMMLMSEDARDALRAWVEKREPRFTGH